jgi:hypothetical protein
MPAMQIIETTAAQWGVFVQMRGVLLKAGAERKAGQEASGGHAGGHRALSGKSWPGAHLGVRQADPDETPLSESECWVAVREGLCNA